MLIQHFTMTGYRVPDPMRPGRTAVVGHLNPSGNRELSYTDDAGKDVTVAAGDHGYFDVPHEVGTRLCRFRSAGSGFYTPGEVDEQVRLGALDEAPEAPKRSGRPRKSDD